MSTLSTKQVTIANSADTQTVSLTCDNSGNLVAGGKLVVRENQVIGIGQTWQDVTASRALGTTYTNTTGKPIQIGFSAGGSASSTQFVATISGVTHVMGFGTGFMEGRFDLIIPNNATYSIGWSTGSSGYTAWKWRELR